jgi:hypothetical protein
MNVVEKAIQVLKQRKFTKWSKRTDNGKKNLLQKKIRELFCYLSGSDEDVCFMLNDILMMIEKDDKKKKSESKIFYNQSYKNGLHAIGQHIENQIKQKKKHYFIKALKQAGLSRTQINDSGIKCSLKLWKSCLNSNERNVGGRPAIKEKEFIKSHLLKYSAPAANRSFYQKINGDKEQVTVQYLNATKSECYNTFEHKDQMAFETFRRSIPNNFKKPHRETDLCEYCEYGNRLKNRIIEFAQFCYLIPNASDRNNYFKLHKEFDSKKMLSFFNKYLSNDNQDYNDSINDQNEDDEFLDLYHDQNDNETINLKNISKKLSDLINIEFHQQIVQRQRRSYRNDRNQLEIDEIVIELDFKQKVLIGKYPNLFLFYTQMLFFINLSF